MQQALLSRPRGLRQEQKDEVRTKRDGGAGRSDRKRRNETETALETSRTQRLFELTNKNLSDEKHGGAARPEPGRAACIRSKRMLGVRGAMAVWSAATGMKKRGLHQEQKE